MRQEPNTSTDIISALYDLINNSKIVSKMYKGTRPTSIESKTLTFAVVDCATRLKNTAENGGGMGKIISRVSAFVRSPVNNVYPDAELSRIEKEISALFPAFGRISFNILDVYPPTDDGKNFYYIIWQLNTTILPIYEGT